MAARWRPRRVTILGTGLGPSAAADGHIDADGRLPDLLADARVFFNGATAPLLTVSDNLIRAIVPLAIADQATVDVQVEFKGVRSPVISFPVLPSRPGVFTQNGSGAGQAAALNQDGTINSPSNPAAEGSIISLYATGLGITDPPLTDGQIVNGPPPWVRGPVSVVFTNDGYLDNGLWANVVYAGAVTGMVAGLVQINVQVPDDPYRSTSGPWAPQIYVGEPWASTFSAWNLGVVTLQ